MLVGHAPAPHPARSAFRRLLALGAPLLALAGCGQPPGFELRWTIESDAPIAAPLMAKQCSEVGIFSVRVTVERAGEQVATEEYPCFEGVGDGPPLEPGEYELEIEGLRRNGEPWEFDEEVGLPRVAWAEATVVVSEGTIPGVEVVLLAPPECDDGIDNDRDGVVDNADPGCDIETLTDEPRESNDAELTLFEVSVSFLHSPAVRPSNVGVHSISLAVDGELLATFAESELDLSQWPFRLPLTSGEFEGSHQLEVTPIGVGGPLASPKVFAFEVPADAGAYVTGMAEFFAEDFLQPIVEPVALLFDPNCTPGGNLELDRMWIRVVDEGGQPLDAASLGLVGNWGPPGMIIQITPVDEADGWVSFECPVSIVKSAALPWGRYQIEAQGRRTTDTCFSLPQSDLAPQPNGAQTLVLARELADDEPVCPECSGDDDCPGQVCAAGLCVDKEPG